MPLWFLVKCWLIITENTRLESLAIVFDDAIEFYNDVPVVLVQSPSRVYGLSELC